MPVYSATGRTYRTSNQISKKAKGIYSSNTLFFPQSRHELCFS
ncbi:hypothetical protein F383_32893 [Gossypium arboreum]|uniref:Uncharacterized protein n=1 Tax=Gossypium arboreum TaxID=29729 RepID=A0A0B0PNK6_GOSAR|nr:hypothetical protein F383_32893 [Gossypium arboreum]